MQGNRFWIEIVAFGTVMACALGLLIATLGAAAVAVVGRPASGHAVSDQVVSSGAPSIPAVSKPSASVRSTAAARRQQTHEGMVTCSRCGAKHSADLGKSAADCARQCVLGGSSYALVDGDRTYNLDGDVQLLKSVAGQRARVVGVIRGNTIKVSSVAASS
jgi:hypothetical protein